MTAQPDMAVGFFGLFALAIMAAIMFLSVMGGITLLTNPKTRDITKVVFGGIAAVFFVILLFLGMYASVVRERSARTRADLNASAPRVKLEAIEQIELEPATPVEPAEPLEPVSLPPDPRTRPSSEDAATEEVTPDEDAVDAPAPDVAEEAADPAEVETEPEEPEESPVAELSVPPLDIDNRPEWVEQKPFKEGSTYYWPVATEPRPDVFEAEEEALPIAVDRAITEYITAKLKLGSQAGRRIHLDEDFVRDVMVGDDLWTEPLDLTVGKFVRVHALVKFDADAKSRIKLQWDRQRLEGRLWSAFGYVAVVLAFLSVVYCYLKIDQVSGGSRRALLRFAAVLVILGLMLVAAQVMSISLV